MAKGSWNKKHLVQGIHKEMDDFKYQIASELGVPVQQGSEDYWGSIPARDCGAVGGEMVKRLVASAEVGLKNKNN